MGKRIKMKNMKKIEKINIISGLVFSVILALSFLFLAGFNLNKKIVSIRQEFRVRSSMFSKTIDLPQKSDYVLQLKYEYKNTDAEVVSLNKKKLKFRVSNKGRDIISRYYYIPQNIVCKGENRLKIKFYKGHPFNIDVRIKNYLFSAANDNIILTVKESLLNNKGFLNLLFWGILFFAFVFSLWKGIVYCGKRVFALSFPQSVLNCIFSFIPGALLFFMLGVNSFKGPYSLVIQPIFLVLFLFAGVVIVNVYINFFFIFLLRPMAGASLSAKSEIQIAKGVSAKELPVWLEKSLKWLRTREFSDKCILFFMFLLILCAFCLIWGLELWAENLANIAYFALVTGVIIKCIKMVRDERKNKNI